MWIVNSASNLFHNYQDYMYPPFDLATSDSIEFPKSLKESGLITVYDQDKYLTYAPKYHEDESHNELKKACDGVIENQVRFSSFKLCTRYARNGLYFRGTKNASDIISDMVSNNKSKLEYLDLSNSSLNASELIKILNAAPADSPLKCIYIGFNDWSKDDVLNFSKFLSEKECPVVILGLHNLLIIDGKTSLDWKQFSEIYPEATKALDDHNLAIAPNINLDVRLEKDRFRKDYDGERMRTGSSYH